MVVLGPNGRRRSLYADPNTGAIIVTGDPGDTTGVPPGSKTAAALYVTEQGKLIVEGAGGGGGGGTAPAVTAHLASTSNPHSVTKAQVGLSNVDNTSDADKPVSTAAAAAITAASATDRDRANHTGVQAPSTLSAGGAATGDSLEWDGTVWTPRRFLRWADDYANHTRLEASRAGGENFNATFGLSGEYETKEWESALGIPSITLVRNTSAPGCGGSLRVANQQVISCTSLIGINPTREYRFTYIGRGDTANVSSHVAYTYLHYYDADRLPITANLAAWVAGTMTELTAPLANGDTVINVTSTAGWNTSASVGARSINLWPDVGGGVFAYTGASGKVYEPLGYTRHSRIGKYTTAITATTLPLVSPWDGGSFPVGTKIANSSAGAAGLYFQSGISIPNSALWTTAVSPWLRGVTSVNSTSLRADGGSAAVWNGASFAAVGALVGYGSPAPTEINYMSGLILESRPV